MFTDQKIASRQSRPHTTWSMFQSRRSTETALYRDEVYYSFKRHSSASWCGDDLSLWRILIIERGGGHETESAYLRSLLRLDLRYLTYLTVSPLCSGRKSVGVDTELKRERGGGVNGVRAWTSFGSESNLCSCYLISLGLN